MYSAFDQCAEAYERFRPGYPPAMFDFLIERFHLAPESVVVDIGAGTGRATAACAARGLQVLAVGPSEPMRAQGSALSQQYPGRIRFLAGVAEATGLPEGCADLTLSAQAFHWFDAAAALREFARILKPGGGLALCWNNRDEQRTAIASDLERLISEFNPNHTNAYRQREWDAVIASCPAFSNVRRHDFYHSVTMSCADLVGLATSISYLRNALDQTSFDRFTKRLRKLVDQHYGQQPFDMVYRLELYVAERM